MASPSPSLAARQGRYELDLHLINDKLDDLNLSRTGKYARAHTPRFTFARDEDIEEEEEKKSDRTRSSVVVAVKGEEWRLFGPPAAGDQRAHIIDKAVGEQALDIIMQTGVFDPADWGLNRAPNLFLLNASLHIQWDTHHAFVLTPDIKLLKSSISTILSLDQEQRAFDAKLSRRAKGRPNVKRKTFINTLAGEHDDDFFYDIIVLRPLLLGVGPPPRNYVDCYIKTNTGDRVSKLYYPEASGDLVDEQNHVLSPFAHESERPANKELHPGGFVVNSYLKLRQYERIAGRACWRSFSPRAQQLVTLIFYLYYLMFRLELAGNPDDPPDDFDSPSGIAKICSAIYRPYLAQAFSSTPPSPSASEPPSPAPEDDLPPPSSPNPSTPSPPRTPPRADSTTDTGLEQTPRALRTRPAQEGASVQIEKEQVKVEEEKVGKAEDLVVAGKSMAWLRRRLDDKGLSWWEKEDLLLSFLTPPPPVDPVLPQTPAHQARRPLTPTVPGAKKRAALEQRVREWRAKSVGRM